jgi:hypothetical protein
MATDIVEIANSALAKIGGASIVSLDDGSRESNLVKLRYNPVRRIVLRMHPWNCAIERTLLAPLAETPEFGFDNIFQLPSQCLRLIEISPLDVFYRIEGRKILANETSLELRYVKDETDVSKLDELLSEAIACYLAWDMAFALTQSNTAREFAWKQFETIKRQAKSIDAQEERDYELTADTFLDARIQGTGGLRNSETSTS